MPTLVGATTAGTWQATTPLAVPEGVVDGDVMLAWLAANDEAELTSPAGWDLVTSDVGGDVGTDTGVYLYSRTASAEPASYDWVWSGEHWHHGICVAVRDARGLRASGLVAAEAVDSIGLPSLDAVAGDMLLGFGYHWGTTADSQPVLAGMEPVASASTILVAAREQIAADGPTEAYACTSAEAGRMAAAAVVLEPSAPPPAPGTAAQQQELPPPPTWRYYAMRWTGEWIHRELPLSDVSITHTLSGPGGLSATIEPVYEGLVAEDGRLVLSEWDTVILAEASGQLRGGGILTGVEVAGDVLGLECSGFTAYAADQPLTSTLMWGGKDAGATGHGVDPATVVRALWAHLQSQPDGGLGVDVDDITTPYRLGEWHNARARDEDGSLSDDADQIEDPPPPIDRVWTAQDSKPQAARGKTVYWQYRLAWWEDVEVGATIDEICQQVPIDFREHYTWADADREQVVFRLELGYPRLGRRRSDLRLVEGENIAELVTVQRSGDDYANAVVAYGAGEGSKQLRQTATARDGRLRRVRTVDASDVTSKAALKSIATDELARAQHPADITGFTLADHPSAQIGAVAPGDDVLVHTTVGWQPVSMWVRITSVEISPDTDVMSVTCTRSDGFDYSGRTGGI